MKKRLISSFLALALAAGLLAGCAGGGTDSGQEGSSGRDTDSVAGEPESMSTSR